MGIPGGTGLPGGLTADGVGAGRTTRTARPFATWFSPQRWSHYDIMIALCALALAVALFVPWFKATVRIRGSSITGFVMDPPPPRSGLTGHHFLWAVLALALLELAVDEDNAA